MNNNEEHIPQAVEEVESVVDSEECSQTKNEDLENDIKQISIVDNLFQKLQNQFNDSQLILKTLQNNLKILHKEVLKERKEMTKKISKGKKKNKKKTTLSGLAFPCNVSKELANFLGLENEDVKISRTDVTSRIIKYIKENELQKSENKKIIILDDKLEILFGPYLKEDDILQFFNLQSYLKYHFIPNKKE